jgi:hypothetical protein
MTGLFLMSMWAGGPAFANANIINGESASAVHHPETGGMIAGGSISVGGAEYDLKILMCSSTLIAPDVVILAAHCIDFEYFQISMGIQFDDIELGFSRLSDLSGYAGMPGMGWPADTAFAWDAVAHPQFSMFDLRMGLHKNFDIALIFLDEPILDVALAVLPTVEEAEMVVEGAVVEVVGWGQQTSDATAPAGTVGHKMTGLSVIGQAADYEFQVGVDADDVRKCHGDSGGPSFLDVGGDGDGVRLVGVTSHAYDETDCRETGGVDTRVDYYLDWIEAEMRARCEDGTRSWCDTDGIVTADFAEELAGAEGQTLAEDEVKGCGCASGGRAADLGWVVAVFALALGRRREA